MITNSPSDLSALIAKQDKRDVQFHQGRLIEWTPSTGANVVEVNGVQLHDLPMLNLSEATLLSAGDVVGVLRVRSTYFMLGRIVVPGSPAYAASSIEFAQAWGEAYDFDISTNGGTVDVVKATATLTVPSWANQALVSSAATVNYQAPDVDQGVWPGVGRDQNTVHAELYVEGFGSGFTSDRSTEGYGSMSTFNNRSLVGVSGTITVELLMWCDLKPAPDPFHTSATSLYVSANATFIR